MLRISQGGSTSKIYPVILILRTLSVDDLVRIKAVIPESINFDYVDEGKFDVNVENSSTTIVANRKDDIFNLKSSNNPAVTSVLFFEFTDGELKPKPNRKKGYSHFSDSAKQLISTGSRLIEKILSSQNLRPEQLLDLLTSETTNLDRLSKHTSNIVPFRYGGYIFIVWLTLVGTGSVVSIGRNIN